MKILAWDPSYKHRGACYAVGDVTRGIVDPASVVLGTGVLILEAGPGRLPVPCEETERMRALVRAVTSAVQQHAPDLVAVEVPGEWYRDPGGGRTGRPVNLNSLRKLALSVGTIFATLEMLGIPTHGVPVDAWYRGRTADRVVWEIQQRYPCAKGRVARDKIMALGILDFFATSHEIWKRAGGADGGDHPGL